MSASAIPKKKIVTPAVAPLPPIEPVSVDIKGAAAFLSTSVRQIRTLIYRRELTAFTLGKKQLLRVADLRTFVDEQAKATA